jgi:hypothetical protein
MRQLRTSVNVAMARTIRVGHQAIECIHQLFLPCRGRSWMCNRLSKSTGVANTLKSKPYGPCPLGGCARLFTGAVSK